MPRHINMPYTATYTIMLESNNPSPGKFALRYWSRIHRITNYQNLYHILQHIIKLMFIIQSSNMDTYFTIICLHGTQRKWRNIFFGWRIGITHRHSHTLIFPCKVTTFHDNTNVLSLVLQKPCEIQCLNSCIINMVFGKETSTAAI